MTIDFSFTETESSFDLTTEETETSLTFEVEAVQVLTDVGASDTDNGNVQIYAKRTSTDDEGNITL